MSSTPGDAEAQARARRARVHQREPRMRALPGDRAFGVDDRPFAVARGAAAGVELELLHRHAGAGLDRIDVQRGGGAGEVEVGDGHGAHTMPQRALGYSRISTESALP